MAKRKRKTRDSWSIARWKKEALKVIQRYVRLKNADGNGMVQCCTCKSWHHYTDIDGGHFIPATYTATAFDLRNISPQCKSCNNWGMKYKDAYHSYEEFMEKTYGREVINELRKKRNEPVKLKAYDYQEIIEEYTDKSIAEEMRIGKD